MSKTHKGHRILVSASRLGVARQWKLCLTIIWSEDGKGIVSKLTINRTRRLRQEAEMDGFLFAKKWIDDGKPELSPRADLEPPLGATQETSDAGVSTQ